MSNNFLVCQSKSRVITGVFMGFTPSKPHKMGPTTWKYTSMQADNLWCFSHSALFRPGSISVDYGVKARAVTFSEIHYSNLRVPKFLNQSYYLIPSSFTTEITSKFKALSVFPFNLFFFFSIASLNHVATLYCWFFSTRPSKTIYFSVCFFSSCATKA